MPTPPESLYEQIVARVRDRLAQINGPTADFWYTPTAVVRVDGFFEEYFETDDNPEKVLYMLRPGDETATEETDEEITNEIELWLLVAKVFQPQVTYNPFLVVAPIPWTIQSRLVRDAKKKLLEDCTLGLAFLENTEIRDVNRDFAHDGWICAELRLVLKYSHLRTTP